MKQFGKLLFFALASLGVSIASAKSPVNSWNVKVKNPIGVERTSEVVSVSLKSTPVSGQYFKVTDAVSQKEILSQCIDYNQDKVVDEIVFVADFGKKEKKEFLIEALNEKPVVSSEISTFCRFVPERTDDFAWENDRIAFRTFGPTAQKMFENKNKAGTLSSGIDCWLKRVNYPIINKWYKGNTEKPGYYHKDHGEGIDNYHVGISRGCGGICVMDGNKYYRSKNFTNYRVIANGPVRSVFELDYAAWDAAGIEVKETKRMVVDLGMHLVRIEDSFSAEKPLPVFSLGITMHNKKGVTKENEKEGWIAYWEPLDDSELGTCVIVADKSAVEGTNVFVSKVKDKSHVFISTKADKNGKVVYYNGYGWKKSGYFNTKEEWYSYLNSATKKIRNPLKIVSVK